MTVTTHIVLPDRLDPGIVLESPKGYRFSVKATSERDDHDQPKYRLVFPAHKMGGYQMPQSKSRNLFTRDQLQAMGCKVVEL